MAQCTLYIDADSTARGLFDKNGVYVDQTVFISCWPDINKWMNIAILVPYLTEYGVCNDHDIDFLNNSRNEKHEKLSRLFTSAGQSRHGYFLLYWCIKESGEARGVLGHNEAVSKLEDGEYS